MDKIGKGENRLMENGQNRKMAKWKMAKKENCPWQNGKLAKLGNNQNVEKEIWPNKKMEKWPNRKWGNGSKLEMGIRRMKKGRNWFGKLENGKMA